jgi:DNA replication protein DnaC
MTIDNINPVQKRILDYVHTNYKGIGKGISCVRIREDLNLSKSKFTEAKQELISLGFLSLSRDTSRVIPLEPPCAEKEEIKPEPKIIHRKPIMKEEEVKPKPEEKPYVPELEVRLYPLKVEGSEKEEDNTPAKSYIEPAHDPNNYIYEKDEYDPYDPGWIKPKPEYAATLKEQQYDRDFDRSNIPKPYKNISWDDYKGTESLVEKKRLEVFSKNLDHPDLKDLKLYLWGATPDMQRSTSIMACNIGKDAIRQGKKVRYALSGLVIDWINKSKGFDDHKEASSQLSDLVSADIIIIDGMFDDNKSLTWKNSKTIWYDFLQNLINKNKKVILTASCSVSTVGASFSPVLENCLSFGFHSMEIKDDYHYEKPDYNKIFDRLGEEDGIF